MKKFALIILLIIAAGTFFDSCSSSTDNPQPNLSDTTNYYPLKTGSFWTYNTTTKKDGTTTNSTDSSVVREQITYNNKTTLKLDNYVNGIKGNESFQYTSNYKLYTSLKSILPSPAILPLPNNLVPDTLVVIADNNSTSWEIFTIPISNLSIPYGGITFTLSGEIKVKGKKSDKATLNVMGKDYTAQKFILEVVINGTIGGTIPVTNFTIQTNHYYVENIGLVKSETLSATLQIPLTSITTPEIISNLSNYTIVK